MDFSKRAKAIVADPMCASTESAMEDAIIEAEVDAYEAGYKAGQRDVNEELLEALDKARQLASVAEDWNLEEVEIDGEMMPTFELRNQFEKAIAKADKLK